MSFSTVLIRGTGLLGASIGLGLRAAGCTVWLSDPSGTAMRIAEDIGAGTVWDGSQHPDLVIVAAPPEATADEIFWALTDHPEALVLDIASVKGSILDELHRMQEAQTSPAMWARTPWRAASARARWPPGALSSPLCPG